MTGIARHVGRLLDLCARQGRGEGAATTAAALRAYLIGCAAACLTLLPAILALSAPVADMVPAVCLILSIPVLGLGWLAAGMAPPRLAALVAIAFPVAVALAIAMLPAAAGSLLATAIVAGLTLGRVSGLPAWCSLGPLAGTGAAYGFATMWTAPSQVELLFASASLAAAAAAFAFRPRIVMPEIPVASTAPASPGWPPQAPGLTLRLNGDGTIEHASGERSASCEMTALPEGCRLVDRVHVSDRVAWLQAVDEARTVSGWHSCDVRLRVSADNAPADQVRYAWLRAHAIASQDGQLVVSMQDIAREKDLEAKLERVRDEADAVEIGKDRFLAAVSHELRTPLNAIIGFSDILRREMFGTFTDARQKEYVTLIHESGAHLLGVVNTMLDVSKLEAGHYELLPESFRIKDIIDDCTGMLALQALRKNVHLADRVPRSMPDVVADRRALKQIIINLLSNAIKFTDAGGCVTIDVVLASDGFIVAVADTGVGMTPDELKRVGKPFVQVENSYTRTSEGTGLGLSLVRGLAELHGGELRMESERGKGTIASVFIPRKPVGAMLTQASGNSAPSTGESHGAARRA